MKHLVKYLAALLLLFCNAAIAQPEKVEMADVMRSEGKIYVVVAIILVVLAGLIAYLFLLDKKLSKMEKLLHERQQTKS
ncbi:CcmD family protein [Fulvivirgaceae bacterium PWU4]|uniref:CcmD family protein n=1 Tax=Chryseosolibacter histidini TaxID=2782349 RepID=A0AAP2GM59_9BACT|nr:CcmD family protein [Chryseosolibacter histidini]MBT1700899.1 CcmD family protein [Chryseosolibacter histidini]